MATTANRFSLSKYPSASLRELLVLAIPLIFSMASASLLVVVDRLFLSYYALDAFEACAAAGGFFFLFQMFCLRFVSTVQAFVGHAFGANRIDEAGSYTWQMIWFSLLSPLVIVPIGILSGHFFFKGTAIEGLGNTYFNALIWGNILFALEGTFAAFFAGIGRTKLIFFIHLLSHALNIGLNYCLIFGVGDVIPSLGLTGAIIGTLTAKGISCIIFARYFVVFFHKNYSFSHLWKLIPKRFLECIQKALPRAIGQAAVILSWNAAAHILLGRGGVDLLICTFGMTVFVPIINEGIGFAFLSVSSFLIGSRDWGLFPKLLRSTGLFILINAAVISIPYILFPDAIISLFEQKPFSSVEYSALINTCAFLGLGCVTNSIYITSFMLITAFKDTMFYMIIHVIIGPIVTYLPVAYFSSLNSWKPEWFWLVTALSCIPTSIIYFARSYYNYNSQGRQVPVVQPIE